MKQRMELDHRRVDAIAYANPLLPKVYLSGYPPDNAYLLEPTLHVLRLYTYARHRTDKHILNYLAAGTTMPRVDSRVLWSHYDRSCTGKPIREDVRSAADEVWSLVRSEVSRCLHETEEAFQLMEQSIVKTNNWLEKNPERALSANIKGLLLRIFRRGLGELSRKHKREHHLLRPLDELLGTKACIHNWQLTIETRILVQQIKSHAGPEEALVLDLLDEGYLLEEIAKMLHVRPSTLRNRHCRALERIARKIAGDVGARKISDPNKER